MVKEKKTMQKHNLDLNNEAVKYNNQELSMIDPRQVPTLIPKEAVEKWGIKDDSYFKIQAIDIPSGGLKANGYFYDKSFFESFLENNKTRPFPGSARGHSYDGRGATNLLMIGGMIKENNDGSATVYLKNFPLPTVNGQSNEDFIKECQTGMVHFSLVSVTDDEMRHNEQTNELEWHVVKSAFGERNDAIDYGRGSMIQKTNQEEESQTLPEKTNKGEGKNKMDKTEVLGFIKTNSNLFTAGELLLAINATEQVVTQEHMNALKLVNELKQNNANEPLKELMTLRETVKKNFDMMRGIRLDKEFEPLQVKIGGELKVNTLREYAGKMLGNVPDIEFEEKLKAFKENDNIAISLAKEKADYRSKYNIQVAEKEKAKDAPAIIGGAQIVEY